MKYRRIMMNGQPWLLPETQRHNWLPWAVAALVVAITALKLYGG